MKYVRELCQRHGVLCDRDKPLHDCFGEYVKKLRESGSVGAEMTERILKSTISILEAFNYVRNNRSLAHDNELLGYDESLLIFNHVCAVIRFLDGLQGRVEVANPGDQVPPGQATDDIPF